MMATLAFNELITEASDFKASHYRTKASTRISKCEILLQNGAFIITKWGKYNKVRQLLQSKEVT